MDRKITFIRTVWNALMIGTWTFKFWVVIDYWQKGAAYDLQPEMNVIEVTKKLF